MEIVVILWILITIVTIYSELANRIETEVPLKKLSKTILQNSMYNLILYQSFGGIL